MSNDIKNTIEYFSEILYNFWQETKLYIGWRDAIEILFFSLVFYYFSRWLCSDKRINLLLYFYSYCGLTLISYALNIALLYSILLYSIPIVFVLFVLTHQKQLQKNFILMANIRPQEQDIIYLPETIIQSALKAINNNNCVTYVIEKDQSLSEILSAELLLHADCNTQLLHVLIASSSFDPKKLVWLNTHNKLIGINASWTNQCDAVFSSDQVKTLPLWHQEALFITQNTDALVIHANSLTRLFTLVINGNSLENCNAQTALQTIVRYMQETSSNKFYQKNIAIHAAHIIKEPENSINTPVLSKPVLSKKESHETDTI